MSGVLKIVPRSSTTRKQTKRLPPNVYEECEFCCGLFQFEIIRKHITITHQFEFNAAKRRLRPSRALYSVNKLRAENFLTNPADFDPLRFADVVDHNNEQQSNRPLIVASSIKPIKFKPITPTPTTTTTPKAPTFARKSLPTPKQPAVAVGAAKCVSNKLATTTPNAHTTPKQTVLSKPIKCEPPDDQPTTSAISHSNDNEKCKSGVSVSTIGVVHKAPAGSTKQPGSQNAIIPTILAGSWKSSGVIRVQSTTIKRRLGGAKVKKLQGRAAVEMELLKGKALETQAKIQIENIRAAEEEAKAKLARAAHRREVVRVRKDNCSHLKHDCEGDGDAFEVKMIENVDDNGPFVSEQPFIEQMNALRNAEPENLLSPTDCVHKQSTPGVTWLCLSAFNPSIALQYLSAASTHTYLTSQNVPHEIPCDRSRGFVLTNQSTNIDFDQLQLYGAHIVPVGVTQSINTMHFYCRETSDGQIEFTYSDRRHSVVHEARKLHLDGISTHVLSNRIKRVCYGRTVMGKRIRVAQNRPLPWQRQMVYYYWLNNPRRFDIVKHPPQPKLPWSKIDVDFVALNGDSNMETTNLRDARVTHNASDSRMKLHRRLILGYPELRKSGGSAKMDITKNGPYLDTKTVMELMEESKEAPPPKQLLSCTDVDCTSTPNTTWLPLQHMNCRVALPYLFAARDLPYLISESIPNQMPTDQSKAFLFDLTEARLREPRENWEQKLSLQPDPGSVARSQSFYVAVRFEDKDNFVVGPRARSSWDVTKVNQATGAPYTHVLWYKQIFIRSCPDLLRHTYMLVDMQSFIEQTQRITYTGLLSHKYNIRYGIALVYFQWLGTPRSFQVMHARRGRPHAWKAKRLAAAKRMKTQHEQQPQANVVVVSNRLSVVRRRKLQQHRPERWKIRKLTEIDEEHNEYNAEMENEQLMTAGE